jgi:tellurite resistance protein
MLAGWFTGQWIYRPLELAKVHPGYFLPSVAGGFVASASAGLVAS